MFKNYFNIKKLSNKINFGFFTSLGGSSNGNYLSLNCSKNNKDKKINVKKNINIAIKKLGIENKKLKLINQIHSNKIFLVDKNNFKNELYGDGLITTEKNIALGVLTADCAPIFIYDIQKTIICCLHSGWKGTLSNISKEGIKILKNNNIDISSSVAVIGPCLGFSSYEVNKKFKSKFIKKNKLYEKFFKSKNNIKDLFDLRGLINFQLKMEGLNKIYNIRKDTYKNADIFFSHRRATHQNKLETGRMINILSFRD